jgi:hypothetical protein
MGLNAKDLELILRLKGEGYFPPGNANIVEIGAQQISNDVLKMPQLVEKMGREFGATQPFSLAEPNQSHVVHGILEHLSPDAPFARDLWNWLGFGYASIDIDGSPGSIPLDLNYDSIPDEHAGKYQLVTNFGTTEHVANQLNAFKIIHDLTAVGGIMIHDLPAQGMINHGLVNYNPKFFWMLARSNGYKWVYMDFGVADTPYPVPQNVADFVVMSEPNARERISRSVLADGGILVAMQKTFDINYVSPLDVPTGAVIGNRELEQRYWTIFNKDAFQNVPLMLSHMPRRARIPFIKQALRFARRKFFGD